ncbi:axonemal dynein light chain domain-containing protein 1 isoform X2 [Lethenteron reissneri]|uniref:axonemal dynein light chain domain-containing protein 1 isoform X2 n=2 Tax=Lethenteron reissneri TaxID=7753 RepID=UPI002AB6A010|nr:axonemal dynein light chain domain-containing protein 1 isoform X2 [Lethenteron reissneri]
MVVKKFGQGRKTKMCADHIPLDLLSSLTPARAKMTRSHTSRASDKVWHYPQQRSKFTHLTDQPVCLTGAGRDLAFLEDVGDACVRKVEGEVAQPKEVLSETFIPEEFHIIQNHGVVGLQLKDSKYTTYLEDDEKNMRTFPSMRPMARNEVVELTRVLDTWLEKLGPMEIEGPTLIHSLLQLVQQEQCIYNAVFHEVIRQVSVQCTERGQLLAKLRERYSSLLSRVPVLVAGLHGDVLATRAQHRRLMEQLTAFQTSVNRMASELSSVRERDGQVSTQAQREREDLKRVLDESRQNANLLEEYHSVYGLHRHRLESSMGVLQRERDGWASAALALASQLTEERSIVTARRLRGHSQAWANVAQQHLLLLSNRDGSVVAEVRSLVSSWAEKAARLDRACLQAEASTAARLQQAHFGLQRWVTRTTIIIQDGENGFGFPEMNLMEELQVDLQRWAESLAEDLERFGGVEMLELTKELASLGSMSARLTALSQTLHHEHCHGHVTALQIDYKGEEHQAANEDLQKREVSDFNGCQCHTDEEQSICDGDGSVVAEAGEGWERVAGRLERSMQFLHARVTGDNGLADALKDLCRAFETWSEKLVLTSSYAHAMPASDWLQLVKSLSDWSVVVIKALVLVENVPSEEKSESGAMDAVVGALQGWAGRLSMAVDREASRLAEQLGMVREDISSWLVRAVLHLASPSSPSQRGEGDGEGERGKAMLKKASSLGGTMSHITRHIARCCEAVAASSGGSREGMALRDLEVEYSEWMEVSQLLLLELSSHQIPPADTAETEDKCSDATEKSGPTVQVIGHDANVEARSLSKEMSALALGQQLQTYNAMATIKQLQAQILSTEARAQSAEECVAQLQEQLRTADDRGERDASKDGLGQSEEQGEGGGGRGRAVSHVEEVASTGTAAGGDGKTLGIPEQRHDLLGKPRSAEKLSRPSKSPRGGKKQ